MRNKWRAWLDETHGTEFELARHFLGRFFDSDLVTEPGQWTRVFVTALALMLPAFCLLDQALLQKYRHFSSVVTPEPYRHAVPRRSALANYFGDVGGRITDRGPVAGPLSR